MTHCLKQLMATLLLCCGIAGTKAQVTVTMPATLTDGTAYYTLFSAPVALDFSATQGLEAYVCTKKRLGFMLSEQTVTLMRVTEAPANTGLLLRATEATTYTLTEAAGPVAAPRRNLLVAVGERTDAADIFQDDGYDTYSPATLTVDTTGQVGFSIVPLAADYKKNADGVYANVYHRDEVFLEAGTAYLGITEFLVKNTLATLVLLSEPEPVPVANGIGDAQELCRLATEDTEVQLLLSNAQVTFATPGSESSDELIVVEDASGGLRLRQSGLGGRLRQGDRISGSLPLTVAYSELGNELMGDATTLAAADSLAIVPGTLQPLVVTDDNVEDYVLNFDWLLVRFTDVTYIGGEEPALDIEMLGDRFPLFDICGASLPVLANGTRMEAVGYLYSLFGGIYFQPIDYIVDGVSMGIGRVAAQHPLATATYNLLGRRSAPRGLYIRNGKKIFNRVY